MRRFYAFAAVFLAAIFLATLFVASAFAADIGAKKAVLKDAPVTTVSPFYAFLQGGVGFSRQQNELTLPGLAVMGSPKEYPTGMLLGGGVGIQAPSTGIGFLAVEMTVFYDFTRASTGCTPGFGCEGYSKNSFRLAQEVLWSPLPTPAQAFGKLPSNAQPAHWPVPITVSGTWTTNVMILPKFGIAERSLDACATSLGGLGGVCDTRWLVGPTAGLQVRIPISAQADLKLDYNFDWYKTAINSVNSPIFGSSTFTAQNEQMFSAGFAYHFPATGSLFGL